MGLKDEDPNEALEPKGPGVKYKGQPVTLEIWCRAGFKRPQMRPPGPILVLWHGWRPKANSVWKAGWERDTTYLPHIYHTFPTFPLVGTYFLGSWTNDSRIQVRTSTNQNQLVITGIDLLGWVVDIFEYIWHFRDWLNQLVEFSTYKPSILWYP